MEFSYYLPVNLSFGRGKADTIGAEAAKYGKKALIVTGRGSARKSGLTDRVLEQLKALGVGAVLFERVEQNPLITTVMEAAAEGRANGCDVVIALGGGSIMDAAKAIALMCVAEGDVTDYLKLRKTPVKGLPLIAVPTTCGTGSEGNGTAVLSNPFNNDKQGMRNPLYQPAVSVVDPLLMKTMPGRILSSVGFDALCHCMEAFTSRRRNPLADMQALEGMRLVIENLPRLIADPEDDDAWEGQTLASTLGGMCIFTSSCVAPHGIEHPASGLRNIVHGRGLAALTPPVYEKSFTADEERYGLIARMLGGEKASDVADCVRRFLERIDLVTDLKEQGVKEEDIPWMTENCFDVSAMMMKNHPQELTKADVEEIYRKACGLA